MDTFDLSDILSDMEESDVMTEEYQAILDKKKPSRMASKREIALKSVEFEDFLAENPELEAKALAFNKKNKPLTQKQKWYAKLQAEMQALALSTLEHLASGKRLSTFEEEVRQELLMAQEMGVIFPEGLIFRGKKDSTLESMKTLEAAFKHENDLDHLDTIISGMNDEERSRFQRVARRFVEENLLPLTKEEEKGESNETDQLSKLQTNHTN